MSCRRRSWPPKRDMKPYAGKVSHVANLIWAMKQFMEQLWAACEAGAGNAARRGSVWKRQVNDASTWISAFLREQHGPLVREWRLSAYLSSSTDIIITVDASPWGLGGVVFVGGIPKEFFRSPVTGHDERRFKFAIEDSRGQQTCEGLRVLVALRVWRKFWVNRHTAFMLQGDNVAALAMACRMKAKAGPMEAIAREIAL